MDEADVAVFGYGCTYERSQVAHCPPAIQFIPYYFFTRFPLEETKIWNLVKLLTPISWFWTFVSIISIVVILKLFSLVGIGLGCTSEYQDITLVPFR